MSLEPADRLPQIDVLLAEDRTSAARQLAQLLQAWGAAAVQIVPSVADALAQLEDQPIPSLVLLDHRLGDGDSCVVALWLTLRPALRAGTRVVVYTYSDQHEVAQSLGELIAELAQPGKRADQVLGSLSPAERAAAEEWLAAAGATHDNQETLFHQVYDAYSSKRLSIEAFRVALTQLCQAE